MKGIASLEKKICEVCGVEHNNGCGVLLNKNLKEDLEMETVTGFGLCKECEDKYKDGYIALVVIKTPGNDVDQIVRIEDGERTGTILHIKQDALEHLTESKLQKGVAMVYVDDEFADKLTELYETINEEVDKIRG